MPDLQHALVAARDFLGASFFGGLLGSAVVVIQQRLKPLPAVVRMLTGTILAVLIGPPLGEWLAETFDLEKATASAAAAGVIAMSGYEGVMLLIRRFSKAEK